MTMTSNDFIQEQLNILNISPKKRLDKFNHLTADYIELQALFCLDEISLSDIVESYHKEGVKIADLPDSGGEIGLIDSEEKDSEEIWIKEIFQICKYRFEVLQEYYPFNLDDSSIVLKDNLTDKQKTYLLLLLASNLNYFPKFKSLLTKDFERVSYESLKNFLPDNAQIKQFGKNSDYSGTAKEKIISLSNDMHIGRYDDIINENATGNQERGLDIIGWLPFKDQVPNMVAILGQCACGKEWFNKKHETERYDRYYRFAGQKPLHSMFIPYALIKDANKFYQADEVGSLLFERFRILEHIGEAGFLVHLESKNIVERCISYG